MDEHGFDLIGEASVDCKQHHFEVQTERAVVQVGTANGTDLVVDEHHLLVQEPRTVTEHPNASAHRFEREQAGGGIDDAMVCARWQQDAYIDTA
ncbi:hypothetical protein D3C85_1738950 [compost metagenome]